MFAILGKQLATLDGDHHLVHRAHQLIAPDARLLQLKYADVAVGEWPVLSSDRPYQCRRASGGSWRRLAGTPTCVNVRYWNCKRRSDMHATGEASCPTL